MQCFMMMIFTEWFYLTHDLFARYTIWLAFLDSLPEPPFSFSLTFFYILPNATPFARFSGYKSLLCTHLISFAVMFCKVSRLLLLNNCLEHFCLYLWGSFSCQFASKSPLCLIVFLGMFNISALFFTDSDRVTINSSQLWNCTPRKSDDNKITFAIKCPHMPNLG